ncbi:porin [Limnobacter litoralis]|uniref:Porin domain-containing protein n=1 Tax=Limnobacter litoralis TaxID=481366 RepID=A0ABQ5YXE3_9BURK|nr:porin [Limnobacter litoralis]GLR27583.1 hypothetical protein GCM10007875_26740 [Limnobacter litoralis]
MISKKILAASVLAAMGTSAHAIGFKAGDWNMDISGSVNAYYTNTKCDNAGATASGALGLCGYSQTGQSSNNIQNGLLPGFIVFSASTTQNGYDLKGVISIDPGTTNSSAASTNLNGGVGQAVGDARRVYLSFGNKDIGTLKLGRDIGLFGSNAILNDMSLLAVGGGAAYNGALNTTLGSIGSGYVYTQFQPQITYTSPDLGGLSLSGGVFQPVALSATTTSATSSHNKTGFQGMATYALGKDGKVWATLINQSRDTTTNQADLSGGELGGNYNIGNLGLTGNYFTGKGLGTTLIGFGGADANGGKRDSNGYLLQATYKLNNTKFGINYGKSKLDATAADTAANTIMLRENTNITAGVYHNLTPSLTLAAEYTTQKQTYQLGAAGPEGKANTFALGAILFF